MKDFKKENIKYSFFANSKYAFDGLKEVIKNETSIKVEIVTVAIIWLVLYFIKIAIIYKFIMGISSLLPILVEFINSAIERSVDLTTTNYHEMAKKAKDAGSASVAVSIFITLLIWLSCLYFIFLDFFVV